MPRRIVHAVQLARFQLNHLDLKAAREAAGVSQSQLARVLGIAQPTLVRWEQGARRAVVTPKQLADVMDALDAEADVAA